MLLLGALLIRPMNNAGYGQFSPPNQPRCATGLPSFREFGARVMPKFEDSGTAEPMIPPPGPLEPVPPATVPEPTPAPTPTTVATAVNALPEECVACIADMIASQGCTLALEGVHNGVSCDACGGEGAGPILGTRYSRDLPEDEETYDLCQEHYASLATKLKALYKATPPPAARPIGRKQVQEGLRDLQAMSAVYRHGTPPSWRGRRRCGRRSPSLGSRG